MWVMRTTLALEDDAMQAIKAYAENYHLSLGKAASELIRRGVRYRIPTIKRNGLTVFEVPDDVPSITSERVHQLLNEE
ncbi:MAG: hypothetical protein ACJ73N_11400 [Bryobacteraceae bacterium]